MHRITSSLNLFNFNLMLMLVLNDKVSVEMISGYHYRYYYEKEWIERERERMGRKQIWRNPLWNYHQKEVVVRGTTYHSFNKMVMMVMIDVFGIFWHQKEILNTSGNHFGFRRFDLLCNVWQDVRNQVDSCKLCWKKMIWWHQETGWKWASERQERQTNVPSFGDEIPPHHPHPILLLHPSPAPHSTSLILHQKVGWSCLVCVAHSCRAWNPLAFLFSPHLPFPVMTHQTSLAPLISIPSFFPNRMFPLIRFLWRTCYPWNSWKEFL